MIDPGNVDCPKYIENVEKTAPGRRPLRKPDRGGARMR
jgi:hypothetical protein